ncbi:hypothetical protein CASFOL_036331 [Castilleja foliolosa]|uniref:Uncharacterized protein n=1 Tax=Castilleja foliolosa TaxID=1961234 RepID=A0ABD3BVW5_9LAMI
MANRFPAVPDLNLNITIPGSGELAAGDVPSNARVVEEHLRLRRIELLYANNGVVDIDDYAEAIVRQHCVAGLRAAHRFGVANPGLQQQLTDIQKQLVQMNNRIDGMDNQLATINARAALGEAEARPPVSR